MGRFERAKLEMLRRRRTRPQAAFEVRWTVLSKNSNFPCFERQKVYFSYRMEFEYDPAKSEQNESKHGVNFEQAKELWLDDDRLVIPARSDSEDRFALLGKMENKLWVMFYTHRGNRVRIISVRRARINEEKCYESGRTG